jgi:SAM-dependent methyltransferase
MSRIVNKISNGISIYSRKLLRFYFGFDRWHIRPLRWKKYAQSIIIYCNKLPQRNSFVEIGCGLGDIVRNVKYVHRFGLDLDIKVLKAAAFLSRCKGKIHYYQYHFPEDNINICGCDKFDCIVLCNWIHNIEPSILKDNIKKYFMENLNDNGIIILDTVQDKGYRYNHEITYLTSKILCTVEKICEDGLLREVWAIKK